MKCPHYDVSRAKKMEKRSAAEDALLPLKASPVKESVPSKLQSPAAKATAASLALDDADHNKENGTSRIHDRNLDEAFEDSGYLSLHSSQINDHHLDEEDDHIQERSSAMLPPPPPSSSSSCSSSSAAAAHREKADATKQSPMWKPGSSSGCLASLVAASTPVQRPRRAHTLSSTPAGHQEDPNLPILAFQRAVCEELTKSYQKNKRYDWSVVTKVAEHHLLDRVIGGPMGLDHVDMFSSLLARNMKSILTSILALLGDLDLISCKKVSRTWRRIICGDAAAFSRCQQAEQALQESRSSLKQRGCGLTRDMALSRVVLSCMQTLASPRTPAAPAPPPSSSSSSSSSRGVSRRAASSSKDGKSESQRSRFDEYVQAAGSLKQHESLRPCRRCGSPATNSDEVQRATCTRQSCLYDFCTRCQKPFHGSAPCQVVQPRPHFSAPRTSPLIPGSARSKRNVRRL